MGRYFQTVWAVFISLCFLGITKGERAFQRTVNGNGPTSNIPPGEDGFIVTLAVFSGSPNPQWTIGQNDPNFSEAQRLFRAANKYKLEEAPPKLGYEGFVVQEVKKGQYEPSVLIVGPETEELQKLLLGTGPPDKVSTALNRVVMKEIQSKNVRPAKRNRMKRYAPWYQPKKWNDGIHVYFNNCYNYASTIRTDTFAQPGRKSKLTFPSPYNGEDVKRLAEADGCVFKEAKKHMCAPSGDEHLAALFVSTERGLEDYHWYRLDNNGYWSHKPGGTPATDLDGDGNKIRDPRKAANGFIPYKFVCFMTIDRTTIQIE